MNFQRLEDESAIAQAEEVIAESLEAETFRYHEKHLLTMKCAGNEVWVFIYDRQSDEYFTGYESLTSLLHLFDQALRFIYRRANF